MSRRPLVVLLATACLLACAPAARADWYASEPVDGPADITAVGGADLGRDGAGAVAYLRRDAGVAHVYVARMLDGAMQAPERVDVGLDAPATAVAVAAGDDRRLVVVWTTATGVYGSFAPGGAVGPLSAPAQLFTGAATSVDVDMGINGTAYATFAAAGEGGSDVWAVRLQGTTWEALAQPLDLVPAAAAGAGSGRPRVAVSAEGNAVATWGEAGAVVARRLTGLALSLAPQVVSLPDFAGAPGGAADSPDIDIEDDGSFAWVVFRQDFGGVSQTLARRLVGSQFEAPAAVGVPGSVVASVAMDERGVGQAVAVAPDGTILGSPLEHDAFGPPAAVSIGPGDSPLVATSERQDVATAWRFGDGQVAGRFRDEAHRLGPQTLLSDPALGGVPAGGLAIGADRAGDVAVAMLQGPAGARYLAVSVYDRPPGAPYIYSSTRYQKRKRPVLKWRGGLDLWGTPTYQFLVDRVVVGTSNTPSGRPAVALKEGPHRLRIVQVDRRGQSIVSRERWIRVDTTPPLVRVRVTGQRRRGSTLKITASVVERRGSGLKYVEVDFGDRSPRLRATRAAHRYRAGKFTLAVKAVDNAGNVTRRTVRLRIKH